MGVVGDFARVPRDKRSPRGGSKEANRKIQPQRSFTHTAQRPATSEGANKKHHATRKRLQEYKVSAALLSLVTLKPNPKKQYPLLLSTTKMSSVVGIDLGFQNSVIAAAGRGGVDVILNGNSNRLNP